MPFDLDAYFSERDRQEAERARQKAAMGDRQQEDSGRALIDWDDAALFAPRAIEGFGRSFISIIPGIDITGDRLLGKSDTYIGGALETITQFGIGFVPGLGVAGAVGKVAGVARGAKALQASKTGRFFMAATQGTIAGAVADFTAFDGHEENLSSMLEAMPGLTNPVTRFLATDEEDPDAVGRIKNVIEGALTGGAVGSAFELVMQGLRGVKAIRKVRTADATPEVLKAAQTSAVDPGTADEALAGTLQARSRVDPTEVPPVEREGAQEAAEDIPRPSTQETAERLTGSPEAAREMLDAYDVSTASRPDPQGSPRDRRTPGGVGRDHYERLRDNLSKSLSKNLDKIVSEDGAAHFLRGVEDITREHLPKTLSNAETLSLVAADIAGLTNIPEAQVVQALSHSVRGAADEVREAMVRGLSASTIMGAMAHSNAANMDEWLVSGSMEAFGRVMLGTEGFIELRNAVFDLKGALGQALQAQAIPLAESEGSRLARLITESRLRSPEDAREIMEQMRAAFQDGTSKNDIAAFYELQNLTIGRKVYRATFELFYESILSAPRTLVIQPMTAIAVSIFRPLENMAGGLLRGGGFDDPVVKRAMFELTHAHTGFMDSLRAAKKAFKNNSPVFDPGVTLRDDKAANETVIRAGLLGGEQDSITNVALNWIGKVVGLPTRLIQSADEFSKQMRGRSVIQAQAMVDGIGQGLSPEQAFEAAQKRMKDTIVDGQLQTEALAKKKAADDARALGLTDRVAITKYIDEHYLDHFDPSFSPTVERALAEAREVTLQTPIEPVDAAWRERNPDAGVGAFHKIQTALDAVPGLRFIVPFYRIPLNIAKFVGQREPITNMLRYHLAKPFDAFGPGLEASRNRYVRDMMSGDPERVADATGRMATGVTLFTVGSGLAFSGQITGRGPTDPDLRKAMMDAGWLPYSFKTPNGYVQYLRMDPFATFFGLMADYADTVRLSGHDEDDALSAATMPMLTALANNFTQRSFLMGLGTFFDAASDPSRNMEDFVEQFAGSVIPNGLAHATELFGDDTLRETNGVLERIMARTPGFSEDAPARRNLLGEPIIKSSGFAADLGVDPVEKFLGMFNPIMYREVSSDVIRRELFSLQHGFEPPKTKILGIDLRQEVTSAGQPAHDRWAELHGQVRVGGKTLRQELSSLIRSKKYQALSGFPSVEGTSPRVGLINKVVQRFRDEAFDQMLLESPALAAEVGRREGRMKDIRAGAASTRRDGLSAIIGNFPTTF